MPKVKDHSTLTKSDLEKQYQLALKGLEDGTYDTPAKAAQAHGLRKSSLGHRRNGRHSQQVAHHDQQVFTLMAEKTIVHWILELDNYGVLPQVDYLTDAVMELAKNEKSCLVQVRSQPQGTGNNPAQTNLIGKNWITCFLNRHPELVLKFASRIDRQCACAANPYIIQTHFHKPEKVIQDNDIKDNSITNVYEKGFIMVISPWTHCIIKRGHKTGPGMAGASGAEEGRRLDKQLLPKLRSGASHHREAVASTSQKSEAPEGAVTRPPQEDRLKRRASAPPHSPSICHRAPPLARRASPTRTSQWLFGDWGVRAGARESPGRPPGRPPPPPGPPSLSAVPGVVAASPLGPPPRRRLGLSVAPRRPHSRRE